MGAKLVAKPREQLITIIVLRQKGVMFLPRLFHLRLEAFNGELYGIVGTCLLNK